MKSVSFIVFVHFIQICFTAPATIKNDPSGLTDDDIREICNSLTDIKGLNAKTRDTFMEVIKKFRKDESYDTLAEGFVELFNLAIQTDSNDLNMTVFKQYLHKSSNNEDIEKTLTQRGLTEEELKLLENSLTEQLPPAQIQHAMLILRGLRKGASFRDREIAIYDLFVSALHTMIYMNKSSSD